MNRFDFIWLTVFCGISALLLVPYTHQIFVAMTNAHPYLMGFIKFAIMATMGELLAIRIVSGQWNKPVGMAYKTILWGVFGMMIVLAFGVFSSGITGAIKSGLLYGGEGALQPLITAFLISATMNTTFGPAFMALHRMTDTYIDMQAEGVNPNWAMVVNKIDWQGFINFVVAKTCPYFWIPAHTVTFLLPPEYRVLVAAYLSIALGAILSYAKRRQVEQRDLKKYMLGGF